MRTDVDAVELDSLLEDYLKALSDRKDLPPAIPGRLRGGTGADLLTAWCVSTDGRRRIDHMLGALKAERRALKSLTDFARLQAATAPGEPADLPTDPPSRKVAHR